VFRLYVATKNKLASLKNLFAKKEEGAAVVEYGLLVGLLATIVLAAMVTLQTTITGIYTSINAAL
jgi:Flp pilus assembly pilin Flp